MPSTAATTKNRKVLVPLATLLVAGAVAVGSGATFTSTTESATAVTSGTLSHTNSQNGTTLQVGNIKPGDTKTGTLLITNNGTLDSALTLQETSSSSSFVDGALLLKIENDGALVYDGTFGGLADTEVKDLGALDVGAARTITFTVSMPASASDANQGKAAKANFRWVTTQTNDDSTLSWIPGL